MTRPGEAGAGTQVVVGDRCPGRQGLLQRLHVLADLVRGAAEVQGGGDAETAQRGAEDPHGGQGELPGIRPNSPAVHPEGSSSRSRRATTTTTNTTTRGDSK